MYNTQSPTIKQRVRANHRNRLDLPGFDDDCCFFLGVRGFAVVVGSSVEAGGEGESSSAVLVSVGCESSSVEGRESGWGCFSMADSAVPFSLVLLKHFKQHFSPRNFREQQHSQNAEPHSLQWCLGAKNTRNCFSH